MDILYNIKRSRKSKTLILDTFGYLLHKCKFGTKYSIGLCTMDKTFYKIEKKYHKFIKNFKLNEKNNGEVSNYVWIFWYQDLDKAPRLVKECINSIKNNLIGKEIILIDKSTINDYVDIPEYILEKLEKGIITITHFSDILRAALLCKYGGIWIDATVFCTSGDIRYITSHEFFVYRNGWMDQENINSASWLIYSKYSNNKIMELTYALLKEYWKKHNYLCNYFLFHMFFKLATDKYIDLWKKVPYYNHINNHLLAYELNNNYDEVRFEEIKKITNFHKLSYKTYIDNPNSFYNKIILKENINEK